MSFLSRISPARAISDFVSEWQHPTPHRWQILGVSAAATFAILMVFLPESQRVPPARPKVTYITTWAPDRTREEIIASNIANQLRKDKLAAERAALEEQKKDLYRALGRATFIDVDAMEAEIAREEAAAQAAEQAPKVTPEEAPAEAPEQAGQQTAAQATAAGED